ncbi:unnamed protein product, partial [Iphiclides podalirius]
MEFQLTVLFLAVVFCCVESERLVNKRVAPQWHIASRDGALKLGADSQIKGDHITTPLRELLKLRDGREILILSGGHGNEEGNNWVEVTNVRRPSERRTIRAPWHFDPDFWVDDVQQFMGRIGDEFQPIRSRLRIVDIAEMPLSTFLAMLLGDSHVILGFCFGWNDRAFRYYLGLRPVTSIVNPKRL